MYVHIKALTCKFGDLLADVWRIVGSNKSTQQIYCWVLRIVNRLSSTIWVKE